MTPEQALARLQRQCSKAEYCCGQVRKKLQRWSLGNAAAGKASFTSAQIESIVEALQKEKFVDDARFANAYVRDKARFSFCTSVPFGTFSLHGAKFHIASMPLDTICSHTV